MRLRGFAKRTQTAARFTLIPTPSQGCVTRPSPLLPLPLVPRKGVSARRSILRNEPNVWQYACRPGAGPPGFERPCARLSGRILRPDDRDSDRNLAETVAVLYTLLCG